MTSRLGRWLRDPIFLLCLTAGLLAFVVQSGELGTADTAHRLQTTHWLWTAEPQVFPTSIRSLACTAVAGAFIVGMASASRSSCCPPTSWGRGLRTGLSSRITATTLTRAALWSATAPTFW